MTEEKAEANAEPTFYQIDVSEWTGVEACPLCKDQSQIEDFVASVHATRPTTSWSICNRCGHVFCNPMPSKAWLDGFYKEGYRKMTHNMKVEDSKNVPRSSGEEEMVRGARILSLLGRLTSGTQFVNCLDIGSSTGALIAGLLHKFSCKYAIGVEPNDAWRQFSNESYASFMGKAEELEITGSEFLTFKSLDEVPRDKRFDLVTLIHVLEHLTDPLETLNTIREHYLKSSGMLLLVVPNLFGGSADPLMFPHLHSFRRETAINIIESAGLHVTLYETGDTAQPFWLSPKDLWLTASFNPIKIGDKTETLRMYNNQRTAVNKIKETQKKIVPTYTMG